MHHAQLEPSAALAEAQEATSSRAGLSSSVSEMMRQQLLQRNVRRLEADQELNMLMQTQARITKNPKKMLSHED